MGGFENSKPMQNYYEQSYALSHFNDLIPNRHLIFKVTDAFKTLIGVGGFLNSKLIEEISLSKATHSHTRMT